MYNNKYEENYAAFGLIIYEMNKYFRKNPSITLYKHLKIALVMLI